MEWNPGRRSGNESHSTSQVVFEATGTSRMRCGRRGATQGLRDVELKTQRMEEG